MNPFLTAFRRGLMFGIPISPPGSYLTLSLRNLGYVCFRCLPKIQRSFLRLIPRFDTFKTNLLTIPHTVLGFCSMFLITLLSEAVNDRAIISMLEDLWALPFLVALYCLPAHPNPWIYYVSLL